VVSPFRAQTNYIRDLIHANEPLLHALMKADYLVDTVHKFQGDERDVILFSPVVSSGTPQGAIHFLKRTPHLFNVAITRARAALTVVGDESAASSFGVEYLAEYAQYVAQRDREAIPSAEQRTPPTSNKYPSVAHPERVSDWERKFFTALFAGGLRPIPQYQVEMYTLDFALIAGTRRLNIEVDGERYHRRWDGELTRRDQLRNQRLIELGWDIKRFWVYQLRDDIAHCVEYVRKWYQQTT
jgi:very-short-patch-repair endonuclease